MAREIPLHWIDAFTSELFGGNPAAVCPLPGGPDDWLDDATLQNIAAENGLSETAFILGGDGDYQLRWFTPTIEVDLCGHATLAAGFAVMTLLEPGRDEVRFRSPESGELAVARVGDRLALDFPARPPEALEGAVPAVAEALDREPAELWVSGDNYMAVFASQAEVEGLWPDAAAMAALEYNVIATAPGGAGVDFVSRYFAPLAGIPEDPVTGSAHCTLTPYWAKRLGKSELFARQVSPRGGELWCTDRGERVEIAGRAVRYLSGTITLP